MEKRLSCFKFTLLGILKNKLYAIQPNIYGTTYSPYLAW
jgi:hypothetical protein